jgi:predicted transcriptional regulator
MVTHMKTTIDIADDLLLRAKKMAVERNVTLRSLIEQALAEVLEQGDERVEVNLVTMKGEGLNPEFEGKSWDQMLEVIY